MSTSSNSEYECEWAEFEAAQAAKHVEHRKRKEAEEWAEKTRKKVAVEAEAAEQQWVEAMKWLEEEQKRKKLVGQLTGRRKGHIIQSESESESKSESKEDLIIDSTVKSDKRCTVWIKRGVPCRWSTVSASSCNSSWSSELNWM